MPSAEPSLYVSAITSTKALARKEEVATHPWGEVGASDPRDEVRANVAAATPLRREGQASEVADLAVYLASPASRFMTGTSVDINGGMFFS